MKSGRGAYDSSDVDVGDRYGRWPSANRILMRALYGWGWLAGFRGADRPGACHPDPRARIIAIGEDGSETPLDGAIWSRLAQHQGSVVHFSRFKSNP